jgi:hypothetical protein
MSGRSGSHLCKGRTRNGKPCRAAATAGGLCFFHANPAKAIALGRLGGKKRHHFGTDENLSHLPPVDSVAGVRDAIVLLVESIYKGSIDPRVGTALTPLLNLQLEVLELYELEQRVTRLEGENLPANNDSQDNETDISTPPRHTA